MGSKSVKVCLFTDTLGDVNGVSRFVCDVAAAAEESGRDLRVLTSTRFSTPRRANIINFRPLASAPMPGYGQLEVVLPPAHAILRCVRRLRPDAIHVSTPGPVGLVGLAAARLLGIPALGVYHTDFPAYVAHLFDDRALTWLSEMSMRAFYSRFARVFTRGSSHAMRLSELGIARGGDRLVRLRPGIDTSSFGPRFRDPGVWERVLGLPAQHGPRVLYVGRISIEKNLPLLAQVWRRVRALSRHRATETRSETSVVQAPQLILVGDGPYRPQMERDLAGPDVHFLGFRHGDELSAIYASSDLFIFPSLTDTLGQVVMEAQASGLPVLVSGSGGPREVVTEGLTGRILPGEDAGAWASATVELMEDPSLRRTMGAAAHRAMQPLSFRGSFEHLWQVHEETVRDVRHSMRDVLARRPERNAGMKAVQG